MKTPVIFVHGIKGSVLRNEYPVDYQNAYVWAASPFRRKFDQAHLHPLDDGVDRDADVWIGAHEAIPMAYESFIDTLRAEYSPYTYVFTYDWRKDNRIAARQLEAFVEAVLRKVNTHLRHENPRAAAIERVTLVGHSMGGLVIKWYVNEMLGSSAGQRVEKIITMATPYQGSLKALEMLTAGARNFFGLDVNKAERHAARTMPGVYQLLPSWDGALRSSQSGANIDVFHTANWQKNVRDALAQKPFDAGFLGKKLTAARDFSDAMRRPFPPALRRRVCVVAGVSTETYETVEVLRDNDNLVNFRDAELDGTTGDGTVPFISAVPTTFNLPMQNIMVEPARPFRDHVLGHHAGITRHGVVQDWILGKLDANEFADFRFTSTG